MTKHIQVVGAAIVRDGLVLCAQRGGSGPLAGMWEFPGGKIEPDESQQQALAREILEELDCTVLVGEKVTTTTYEYEFAVITLTTFYCELLVGQPTLSEHQALEWLPASQMQSITWAPADVPAVELIVQDLLPA